MCMARVYKYIAGDDKDVPVLWMWQIDQILYEDEGNIRLDRLREICNFLNKI